MSDRGGGTRVGELVGDVIVGGVSGGDGRARRSSEREDRPTDKSWTMGESE